MKRPTARKIINHLGLEPLPVEGGWYLQTYMARETISGTCLPQRYGSDRAYGTSIYYLLTDERDCFSALHLLKTDEIWHFYLGDPAELLLLYPDGTGNTVILGPDIIEGQHVQYRIPRNTWQGCRLQLDSEHTFGYALMGTTMAPAFAPEDFTLGEREALISRYPQFSNLISRLTRGDSASG